MKNWGNTCKGIPPAACAPGRILTGGAGKDNRKCIAATSAEDGIFMTIFADQDPLQGICNSNSLSRLT